MSEIHKYPRTRHIEGSGLQPGDDPVCAPFAALAGRHLVVEEKMDGANSAISFAIGTSRVTGLPTGGNVFATAGGVTKSIFVNVSADPNAPPLLQSMTITPTSVRGGTSATGTVFLSSPAPAGGISVTLATSNLSVASVPGIVNVPGGQTSANFTVTTFAVGNSTAVTITAFFDTTISANLTVTAGAPPSRCGRGKTPRPHQPRWTGTRGRRPSWLP